MTYQAHALLRFGGAWFTSEQWSCGIRVATSEPSNTVQNWIDALEPNEPGGTPLLIEEELYPLIRAWFLRPASQISQRARLDYVSMNAIGPDGKYADPGNPHTYEVPTADRESGTSAAQTWPQLTTVVSLRSAQTRGLATHGRVYTPTAPPNGNTGRLDAGTAQGIADSFGELVEEISQLSQLFLAGELRVIIASDQGSPGPQRIVTRTACGDVNDTQRRRRNQLAEVYYFDELSLGS